MTARFLRTFGPLAAAALLSGALPAEARPLAASTRLRACGSDVCLLVTGSRTDGAAPVSLAGHDVAVRGGRNWRAIVPLADVRAWSAPLARSIRVAVGGPGGGEADASLPIGLLGQRTELAFLDVSARH